MVDLVLYIANLSLLSFWITYLGRATSLGRSSIKIPEAMIGLIVFAISHLVIVKFSTPSSTEAITLTISSSVAVALTTRGIVFGWKSLSIISTLKVYAMTLIVWTVLSNDNKDLSSPLYSYWHTGSNDLIDGFCGAASISKGSTASFIGEDTAWRSWPVKPVSGPFFESGELTSFSDFWICGASKEVYVNDPGALQYSLLAAVSDFTHTIPNGFTFLYLGFLSLVFFFKGVQSFAIILTSLSSGTARTIALFSTFGTFYFTTFVNSHLGTLLISGPLVFWLIILYGKTIRLKLSLTQLLILVCFISATYLYIVPFLALIFASRVIFLQFRSKMRLQTISFLHFFALCMLSTFLFLYLADSRERSQSLFRAWGTIHTSLAPLQYLGILPGNVMGSTLLGDMQQLFSSFGLSSNKDLFIFGLLISLTVFLGIAMTFKHISDEYRWLILIVGLLPFIIFATSQDSYFTYKILYIFQFILITFCIAGYQKVLVKNLNPRASRYATLIMRAFSALVLILNLGWTTLTVYGSVEDAQKRFDIAKQLDMSPNYYLKHSISMEDETAQATIANYIFYQLGTKGQIKDSEIRYLAYFLYNEESNRYEIKFEKSSNNIFRLAPNGVFPRERDQETIFNWVSGNSLIGENKRRVWNIEILKLNRMLSESRLDFCTRLAAWIPMNAIELQVLDQKGVEIEIIMVSKEKQCDSVIVDEQTTKLVLVTKIGGEYPTVFDRRKLLYQLWID